MNMHNVWLFLLLLAAYGTGSDLARIARAQQEQTTVLRAILQELRHAPRAAPPTLLDSLQADVPAALRPYFKPRPGLPGRSLIEAHYQLLLQHRLYPPHHGTHAR